jgi:hypothetical protein
MGHIAKNCPARREEYKKRNKRHHAHAVEDEEPPTKMIKEQIEDYVLISALSGSVSPGEDTWLIDKWCFQAHDRSKRHSLLPYRK